MRVVSISVLRRELELVFDVCQSEDVIVTRYGMPRYRLIGEARWQAIQCGEAELEPKQQSLGNVEISTLIVSLSTE